MPDSPKRTPKRVTRRSERRVGRRIPRNETPETAGLDPGLRFARLDGLARELFGVDEAEIRRLCEDLGVPVINFGDTPAVNLWALVVALHRRTAPSLPDSHLDYAGAVFLGMRRAQTLRVLSEYGEHLRDALREHRRNKRRGRAKGIHPYRPRSPKRRDLEPGK